MGRLSGLMNNCSHEVCMMVSRGVVSLRIFLSSEEAGRSREALIRESREVQRDILGPGLSPLGSLAMITPVGWMWRV